MACKVFLCLAEARALAEAPDNGLAPGASEAAVVDQLAQATAKQWGLARGLTTGLNGNRPQQAQSVRILEHVVPLVV